MIFKIQFNKNVAITVAAILVILTSCKSGNQSSNKETVKADSLGMNEISRNVKDVVYPLPTPFEMTNMLNTMGAKYTSSILNPADHAEKYFTEKSKALNVGVYGADLAYATTYDQKQDVKIYSKALKSLIDQLGININYTKLLSDDASEKLNNKDTLVSIITNMFYDTYRYINNKNNPDLAIIMVSGAWTEVMYIATNISHDTYNNSGIVKLIAGQKDSYTKLMKLLGERDKSPDIKDLETKLAVLKPVYDKVDSGLTESDYMLILRTIQTVRKSIII
jgi:hypothetical protein